RGPLCCLPGPRARLECIPSDDPAAFQAIRSEREQALSWPVRCITRSRSMAHRRAAASGRLQLLFRRAILAAGAPSVPGQEGQNGQALPAVRASSSSKSVQAVAALEPTGGGSVGSFRRRRSLRARPAFSITSTQRICPPQLEQASGGVVEAPGYRV